MDPPDAAESAATPAAPASPAAPATHAAPATTADASLGAEASPADPADALPVSSPAPAPQGGRGRALALWFRRHDPGYTALRRALRTALIMPAMFAIGDKLIANPAVATFAAFGAFAMLLLVDFAGPMRQRLQAQAVLAVICCGLIALGTLASGTTWLAACAMAVVGFVVLFVGIFSSTLAAATTTMLLAFILPVSLAGPASSIPDRITGWGMSAAASLLAIWLLWPAPERHPVRDAAVRTCRAIASRLRAEVDYALSGFAASAEAARDAAVRRAAEAVHGLEQAFFSTPYPTTGLSTAARTIVRLVEELRWLNTVALRDSPHRQMAVNRPACVVKGRAGAVLEHVAELLDAPLRADDGMGALLGARAELREALTELERATTLELPATVTAPCRPEDDRARVMISSLDPSFRAQELSFVVSQIAENTEYAVAADRRNWRQRWLGRQPQGRSGTVAAARRRAGAHVERNSVWLHNSLRGGAGLALAVLVADLTGVQHAFWVVFGTLSVLRSNALSTGDNVLRALLGTSAGFIVGGVLVSVIGTNETLLWVLLPFVVLLAGLAPAVISYAAGQAAFTLTLLILFNILEPAGLTVGLVRIEDVALGGAVSLVVGVLFWPRGAAGALGRALAEGYGNGVSYLAAAVAFGSGRCDASGPTPLAPRAQAQEALAAARRLDEAFRGYLSERGAKPLALADMTRLVTGVAGVRLAADAILELWQSDRGDGGDRRSARRELLARAALMTGWYDTFAASLSGSVAVPTPMAPDATADEALTEAVGQDLRGTDGEATAAGVRVIWTSDHLDAVRRLQDSIVGPARTAAAQQALR